MKVLKSWAVHRSVFCSSTKRLDGVLVLSGVDEAEKARVLEAEKAGKGRKTLIDKLQG